MQMRRFVAIASAVLFSALLLCSSLLAQEGETDAAQDFMQVPPYEIAPFGKALRPEFDVAKTQLFGGASLTDLTLYTIEIDVDLELGTLNGRQQVIFKNRENVPLKEVYFRIYPNAPYLTSGGKNIIVTYAISPDRETAMSEEGPTAIKLQFKHPVQPEEKVNLRLAFKGIVPRIRDDRMDIVSQGLEQLLGMASGARRGEEGVKGTDYGVFGQAQGIMSLAGFYPTIPAYDEHGWDIEPPTGVGDVSYYDVSNYLVSITTDAAAVQVSSGVKIGEKPAAVKGQKTVYHLGTAIRDFNALLSKRLQLKSRQVSGTTINSYFVPGHETSAEKVLSAGAEAFRLYSSMFGPYPYKEFDLAEAPLIGGAGGVEFPGMCTIAMMLYSNPFEGLGFDALMTGSPVMEQTLEFVVAHEVAHQWWNGIVGSDSKRYPFIDEALASYSAMLYFEKRYGKEAARGIAETQVKLNYTMYRMIGGEDRPAGRPARDFENQFEYAALVYGKAPYFYQALRNVMGDGAFFQSLRRYYAEHSFRIAGPKDFVAVASARADRAALAKLYERWINGAHGDEDLGQADLSALLQNIFGGAGGLDSEELQHILPLLQGILGGGQVQE